MRAEYACANPCACVQCTEHRTYPPAFGSRVLVCRYLDVLLACAVDGSLARKSPDRGMSRTVPHTIPPTLTKNYNDNCDQQRSRTTKNCHVQTERKETCCQ
mmetsp:Transcript_6540/g.17782  ORF Transcript_6540/g.17782 Transcript_6540/m.17782 type:complete len:101 (+) Transcript_6540:688-990(+)